MQNFHESSSGLVVSAFCFAQWVGLPREGEGIKSAVSTALYRTKTMILAVPLYTPLLTPTPHRPAAASFIVHQGSLPRVVAPTLYK